jgi:hypothetical protein
MDKSELNEAVNKAISDGYINVYTDTPEEVVNEIKKFNIEMGECRVNRGRMKKFELVFLLLNPILSVIFYITALFDGDHIAVASVATLLFLGVFFVFTMIKKNYLVVSVAASALLVISLKLLILLAIDLVIAVLHMNIDSELKQHRGYIAFNDVRLIMTKEHSDGKGNHKIQ